jgi:hypothetical protein
MKKFAIINNNRVQNTVIADTVEEVNYGPDDSIVDITTNNTICRDDYYLTESNTHVKPSVSLNYKGETTFRNGTGSYHYDVEFDGDLWDITEWQGTDLSTQTEDLSSKITNKLFSSSGSSFDLTVDEELLEIGGIQISPNPPYVVHPTHGVSVKLGIINILETN